MYAAFFEDSRGRAIKIIALGVDNLADANLRYLNTASQTGTRVAVQNRSISDPISASFEQSILLGVKA